MATKPPGPVPGHPQKHDPAWKHVQILSLTGDKKQLKCIYCGKIFNGGGIHRIKEHLACQKGNASRCPRVPEEVQDAMRASLNGPSSGRKRKVKVVEESDNLCSPIPINMVVPLGSQCEVDNNGIQLLVDGIDPNSGMLVKREEVVAKTTEKRKRGRPPRVAPAPTIALPAPPPMASEASAGAKNEPLVVKAKDQLQNDQGQGHRDQAHLAIGQFFYTSGIPLDGVNSIYFQTMIDAISAAGPGLKAPTYHDLRGSILKSSVDVLSNVLEQHKVTWGRTGCTIICDEWTTPSGMTLIDFLVSCPEGTFFLKSVDTSNFTTSIEDIYELLKRVVEEVGVDNVLQVITVNNDVYMAAGRRLSETYPTLFWTPCTIECISLILEDVSKIDWISSTFEHAQTITKFIYNYPLILNLLRKYCTGKELLQPMMTRSAASFATLHGMVSLKDNLTAMFDSVEWLDSEYANLPGGVGASELVGSETFWSSCSTIVRLTEPLLRILHVVNSDKRPAMGYIYEGMYRAKEAIKSEFKEKKDYRRYWEIIDSRWDTRVPRPLHAAGFFLNPQFLYSVQGDVHNEIMSGMLDCIERLVPDTKVQDKINMELNSYKTAVGDFGRKIADRARYTSPPADWWSMYGGSCPNLSRLAIRILSQSCNANGFEHDHIPFENVHSEVKNRLEHERLKDLVFVQYNMKLRERKHRSNTSDPLAFENLNVLEGWVMEESFFGAEGKLGWKGLVQPGESTLHLPDLYEEHAGLTKGYDDDEIYSGGRDKEGIGEDGES